MYIDKVRVAGNELILSTVSPDARRLAYNFKAGEYELKRTRKKRSRNANAYCWELCTKIAEVVGITKEEAYRHSIKEVGIYTPLPIENEKVDRFCEIWQQKGVGWFAEVIDDSKIKGYKLVFAYQGSSTYNTKEMSRLIENLIQDANAVGIDTLSESEKALLLEEWGNAKE